MLFVRTPTGVSPASFETLDPTSGAELVDLLGETDHVHLNATGRENLRITYTLNELDSTTANQRFALRRP